MYILDNPPRLAKLLTSIKVPGTNRPLSPVDVAREIEMLLKDLGGDESELLRRLPIKQDIMKDFRCLLRLPPEIQGMIVWGRSKHETGGIGFSVASRIASLDRQDDMRTMAGTVADMPRPVTKEEIEGILSLKKNNPDKPIGECLTEVLNVTRPAVIDHYIFLSGLDPNIVRALEQKAHVSVVSTHELASGILRGVFPEGSFKTAKVFSDCIRLSLEKHGSDFISEYSKSHNIPVQRALSHMIGSEMMKDG